MSRIIGESPAETRAKIVQHALNVVQHVLPAKLIEQFCRAENYTWRDRVFAPGITVLACIWKHLLKKSCREIEDWHAALGSCSDQTQSRDGKGFCDARRRVPEAVYKQSLSHVGASASKKGAQKYGGLDVMLVDGTTFRTPLTRENAAHFGRSVNQAGKGGFPLVRVVLLVCAGCAAIVDAAIGPYRGASEMRLFREMLLRLRAGLLLIGDCAFGSYLTLWKIEQCGSHALLRHRQSRRSPCVRKLGHADEIQLWQKPKKWQVAWHDWLESSPQQIEVRVIRRTIQRRGYKSWELLLCTTLLDPKTYRADDLVELYLQRWDIELDLRSLKAEYNLDQLGGKTPGVIRREILSGMLAYTAVRHVMAETGENVRRLSHDRAKQTFIETCSKMSAAPAYKLPEHYADMLNSVRSSIVCKQIRLPQPRSMLARPRKYPYLRTSRKAWRRRYRAAS